MTGLHYNGGVRTAILPARIQAISWRRWLAHLAAWLAAEEQGKRWPVLILSLHLVLGVIYSAIVPIWEAYDETGHYAYVRYVAVHWALPSADEKLTEFFDESHQPPLYYLLGAIAISWIDTSDNLQPVPNIHARDGSGLRGFNLHIHGDNERFPWRGTVLAIHVARLVSVLATTATLWLTYRIGRRLFPEQPGMALGAMAVNAFLPQFLFIGAIVNNDSLMTFISGAVLLAVLNLFPFHSPARGEAAVRKPSAPTRRRLITTGAALGLSLLTKNSGLALIPFVGLALIIVARRLRASWRQLVLWGIVVFGVAALVSAPWYGYNWVRYGRLLTDRAPENPILREITPLGPSLRETAKPIWAVTLINNTFRTFWAAFGWGNVIYPDGVYLVLGIICLIGLVGAVLMALRSHPDIRLGLSLIVVQAMLIASQAIYRAVYFQDPMLVPGRYLLPAVSGLSLLLFAGWAFWVRPMHRVALAAAAATLLALLAIVTPWTTIAPAYARPPILTLDEAMEGATPVYLRFGNSLELLGYRLSPERISPGETLQVTLVWRARSEMSENYTIGLHLLDGNLRDWGQIDTYPGRGNFATSLWRSGDIIRDTYTVRLRADAPSPAMGRLALGVQLFPGEILLPVTDEQGRPVTPIFGRFKIAPETLLPPPSAPMLFRLGESLALVGIELPPTPAHPGETVQVRLTWQVQADLGGDYTAFLHALDRDGLRFQADRPPLEGAYPTSLWEAGEMITDAISMTIPQGVLPGSYRLVTGLYDPRTDTRLPALAADGRRQPNDAIVLGEIQVVR